MYQHTMAHTLIVCMAIVFNLANIQLFYIMYKKHPHVMHVRVLIVSG